MYMYMYKQCIANCDAIPGKLFPVFVHVVRLGDKKKKGG